MKSTVINFRCSDEFAARLDEFAGGKEKRSAYIREAIEARMTSGDPPLTDKDKKTLLKNAKTLQEMLDEAMRQRISANEDFLKALDDNEFARLVAGRLPKQIDQDQELEADVLSLRDSIAKLPGIPDITRELNRAKGEIVKLKNELAVSQSLIRHAKGRAELRELMETVFKAATHYAVDLVARNQLPGFGDGGGLTPRGYEDISREVERILKGMEVSG